MKMDEVETLDLAEDGSEVKIQARFGKLRKFPTTLTFSRTS